MPAYDTYSKADNPAIGQSGNPSFTATVADREGNRGKISREAGSEAELRESLRAEGYIVLGVEKSKRRSARRLKKLSLFEIETGLRQLSSLLKSGVSLVWALDTIAGESRGGANAWNFIQKRVTEGGRLADAMREANAGFDELTCTLAQTGEDSGELDKALRRASEQLESRRELRLAVLNALAYPMIAVLMALGVSAFLVTSVIPKISEFLISAGADLPETTRLMLDIADFFREKGVAIATGLAATLAAWFVLRQWSKTREIEDAFLLKVPVTGGILRLSAVALVARSMQMMLDSGVTLLSSLGAAAGLPANRRFRRRIANARDAVEAGSTLKDAFAGAKEFPGIFKRMVAVGEQTGNLADAFGEAAYFHEGALKRAVKRFSIIIEPVLILVTAVIVGFVYIAFFMALFSLSAAA